MTDRELMQQALDALGWTDEWRPDGLKEQAITALRERLAQPEQKPIAWVTGWHDGHCVIRAADPALILPIGAALYTTPPQRKPLTESELFKLWVSVPAETEDRFAFARAVEAKLKEKNT